MSTPAEPTQEQRYERIEKLRDQLDEIRNELYEEIRAAFPENRGGKVTRGVLAEVTRRSRWSREYVAQIREGKNQE
ncbi:hypothetical protein [Nocardiopsis alba]|uniref:Uncharacterized protein n=1 Tax=Nocardiopsis alba TaxID=53437 RepID=A0A7K2ILL8_9ACTN|nr:hypothetical protein [Nocardiopsis alba]MYR30696.1 hypothetical protein [Nocardiopsis alba]MYR30766.1 hypothetical protein [Nocardiopsis alba]